MGQVRLLHGSLTRSMGEHSHMYEHLLGFVVIASGVVQ